MKAIALLLVTALLSACSSTREVYTQEGDIVYAISCRLQSYQSCMEEAGQLCGTLGYKFVMADGTPAPPPPLPSAAPPAQVGPTRSAVGETPVPASAPPPADPSSPPAGYALQRKFFVRCHS